MTANQVAYQSMLETQRSNRAKEAETNRANLAKEFETNRSNLETEKVKRFSAVTDRQQLALDKLKFATGAINTVSNKIETFGKRTSDQLSNAVSSGLLAL